MGGAKIYNQGLMTEGLKSQFEIVYQDFKKYEDFLKAESENIKKERENFNEFAVQNKDNMDLVLERLFEINERPTFYREDFQKLGLKLYYTYETLQNVLEIPQEIRTEIENLKPRYYYNIFEGQAKVIDQEYVDKISSLSKETYKQNLKKYFEQM